MSNSRSQIPSTWILFTHRNDVQNPEMKNDNYGNMNRIIKDRHSSYKGQEFSGMSLSEEAVAVEEWVKLICKNKNA
jgi:hypothetical protein